MPSSFTSTILPKNLLFKDLFEYREKQEMVPFNYSLGGGTQGLLETNTIGGAAPLDENLYMQKEDKTL